MAVTGADNVRKNLLEAAERMKRASDAALYQKGFEIAAASAIRTPVDTNTLRASHYTSPPIGDPSTVQVGVSPDYAVPVHERTKVSHTVGEAKFLKKAIDEARPDWLADLGQKTSANFKAGIGVSAIPVQFPSTPKE